MNEKQLIPKYDNRNSFYGKAIIKKEDNKVLLYSYNTLVAIYDHNNNTMTIKGWFSSTTARHINEFLQQYGFDELTTKEMEKSQLIEGC